MSLKLNRIPFSEKVCKVIIINVQNNAVLRNLLQYKYTLHQQFIYLEFMITIEKLFIPSPESDRQLMAEN
jgi:hypothetical protein